MTHDTNTHTCSECRYYIPTPDTFYNKPCGYCGNFAVQRRRVSDARACKNFELRARIAEGKPP